MWKWIKNQDPLICYLQETHFKYNDISRLKVENDGFPGSTAVKNLPANAGDMGSSPGPGRSHMPRSN